MPGATAFLEWKFINNAGLDNKKNSPAVSHCSALSKGRVTSLKSQKKTNYETQIIRGDFSLSEDSVGHGQIIQTATLPKLWGLLIRWNNNGIHAKLLTSCCCFIHPKGHVRRLLNECECWKLSQCATAWNYNYYAGDQKVSGMSWGVMLKCKMVAYTCDGIADWRKCQSLIKRVCKIKTVWVTFEFIRRLSNFEGVALMGVPFKMCTKKLLIATSTAASFKSLKAIYMWAMNLHTCAHAHTHVHSLHQTIVGAAYQHCSTVQREKWVLDYNHQPLLRSCIILWFSVHVTIYVSVR